MSRDWAHDVSANLVVISFVALHGDPYTRDPRTGAYVEPLVPGPTLAALGHPSSLLRGRVSDWYYLVHPATSLLATRVAGRDGSAVARDVEAALARELKDELRPRFHAVPLATSAPPNDHADLFDQVKEELRLVRLQHPRQEIVLSLSHGTPTMHAVMFLAGSVGVVDGTVTLVQIERNEGALARPNAPVAPVHLRLSSVLQAVRSMTPATNGLDAAPTPDYSRASSPRLLHALRLARAAAAVPFPLLLRGERGVGKSTIAALIRAWGRFRKPANDKSWAAVACGQFPDPDKLRVELCGAKRGAYTGLDHDRRGLLERADGDTLFLDEIQDLAADNQRVIIRLLEDHSYYRVGEEGVLRMSNFRLITGTNWSDQALAMKIRPDFFDRISEATIEIPPLRECRDDLPWMWDDIWREAATKARIAHGELASAQRDAVLAHIARHALPGNWRDLRRLAVRLTVAIHVDGRLTRAGVGEVLREFPIDEPETGSREPAGLTAHEAARFKVLEAKLGPMGAALWARVDAGRPLRKALEDLLGDRHKALRAVPLLQRACPERFEP